MLELVELIPALTERYVGTFHLSFVNVLSVPRLTRKTDPLTVLAVYSRSSPPQPDWRSVVTVYSRSSPPQPDWRSGVVAAHCIGIAA